MGEVHGELARDGFDRGASSRESRNGGLPNPTKTSRASPRARKRDRAKTKTQQIRHRGACQKRTRDTVCISRCRSWYRFPTGRFVAAVLGTGPRRRPGKTPVTSGPGPIGPSDHDPPHRSDHSRSPLTTTTRIPNNTSAIPPCPGPLVLQSSVSPPESPW